MGNLFFVIGTADGPAMAWISGGVGCQGKIHCRGFCPLKGRHRSKQSTYYPLRFKPDNYNVEDCNHADVDLTNLINDFIKEQSSGAIQRRYKTSLDYVLASPNMSKFKERRLDTGLCKPSIFSGLNKRHMLEVPSCFASDIMHLPALNMPELLIPLWNGKFRCDKKDSVSRWAWALLKDEAMWIAFGKDVADATSYIPGSFDRPPRNPAEKINSGYKAWEYLLLLYGLGPCLLRKRLPAVYWEHYCKLVRGIQILLQDEITVDELYEAHNLLTVFSDDFETLYIQRLEYRMHLCRPCVHGLSHLVPEAMRIGPGGISSQWSMERTIGNLGQEIRQHQHTYANLSNRAIHRAQTNALLCMVPDLVVGRINDPNAIPSGAKYVGNGYYLFPTRDAVHHKLPPAEATALHTYLTSVGATFANFQPKVVRWARLRIPNGQQVRSKWREEARVGYIRRARNAMVVINTTYCKKTAHDLHC